MRVPACQGTLKAVTILLPISSPQCPPKPRRPNSIASFSRLLSMRGDNILFRGLMQPERFQNWCNPAGTGRAPLYRRVPADSQEASRLLGGGTPPCYTTITKALQKTAVTAARTYPGPAGPYD